MAKQLDIAPYLELAKWQQGLIDTTNYHFMPLYADENRYLVLKGGGGSGKSIFAGRKILERVSTEPHHRWLVVRKVAKTIKNSCFAQLVGQAYQHYSHAIDRVNRGDFEIRMKNGSVILFAGLDDVEKLKSIYNITGIWIEEASEVLEADFNQLDIRLRRSKDSLFSNYMQMIVSFNPVSITHWLKKRFFDMRDERATVHESTYLDNRFLDDESIRTLQSFARTDSYYYTVYCLGMWGITGKSVFDGEKVTMQLQKDIKPVKIGYFDYKYDGISISDIKFVEDKIDGFIKIYKDKDDGVPYVIGGDTAGDGSDSFVGQVIDNQDGQQVATLRHQFDEDLYARQMYCLGMYYNTALIAVETNFSTFPVKELERLRYKKQYVRESVDDYTHKVKHSFGYFTGTKTRPLAVAELVKVVREDVTMVVDKTTLEEMLTFVRNEDFKPEAEEGAHDDCVIALAIAHQARGQQEFVKKVSSENAAKWTADMWQDYRRASPVEKEQLIRRWGRPKGEFNGR